jgi:outer membrane assembly lipoprotein YfiO
MHHRSHLFLLFLGVVFSTGFLGGCSGLGRKINQALPEFLRSDPGEEEIARLGKRRRSLTRSVDEVAAIRLSYDQALSMHKRGEHEESAEALEVLIETYPDSSYDQAARLLQIRAYIGDDEFYDASVALRAFLQRHPGSERSGEVEELAYSMAEGYLSGDQDLWVFDRRGDGIKLLEDLVIHFPNGRLADDAWWRISQYHLEDDEWIEAQAAFDAIVDRHKDSEWAPISLYYRGYCRFQQIKGVAYDVENMRAALKDFNSYLKQYPEGAEAADARVKVGQVREKIARKNLSIARWYEGRGKPGAARFYYQFTVARFGDTQAAEQARFLLGTEGENK